MFILTEKNQAAAVRQALRQRLKDTGVTVAHPGGEVLVLEGEGTLRWEGGSLSVKRGDELFVPHGVASYRLESAGRCRLLVCGVPEEG
mgnify:CR=1 FL=1